MKNPIRPTPRCLHGTVVTRLLSTFALCIAATMIWPTALSAQTTGAVSGKVISASTKQALGNAEIFIDNTRKSIVTETDGTFYIGDLAPGSHTIRAAYTDLDAQTKSITVNAGETATIEFTLSSDVHILDAFVVSAEREGQASAIQQQRQSDVMKTVVSSDVFGDLVDTNPGEFLKNLPGVFVNFSGEDIDSYTVRGISSADGSFTMDGNSMANSSTNPETSNDRGITLKNVSMAAIESFEVYKSPPPSQPANGNGGSINMVTRDAFNLKGRRISVGGKLVLNTEALDFSATPGGAREPDYKWGWGFSLYYSEALFNNRFGVSLDLSTAQSYRFNNQIGDMAFTFLQDGAPKPDAVIPTKDMAGYVNDYQLTENGAKSEKRNASLNLDYKLSRTTSVYLKTSYRDDHGLGGHPHTMRIRQGTVDIANSDFDTTEISNVAMSLSVGGAPKKNGYSESWSINPGVKHRFGGIRLNYDVYTSRAFTKRSNGISSVSYTGPTGRYRLSDITNLDGATIEQIDGPDYLNLDNYRGLKVNSNDSQMVDKRSGAKFNLSVPVTVFGAPLMIQAGALYTEWSRNAYTYKKNYTLNDSDPMAPKYSEFYDPVAGSAWKYKNTAMPNWISQWKVRDFFEQNPQLFTFDQSAYNQSLYRYTKDNNEKIWAGYLMGTLQVRNLSVMAGARYEYTKGDATGSAASVNTMMTGNSSYGEFFPNVQLKYSVTKDLILRAAYTTSMSRPRLEYLIPANTVSEDDDDMIVDVSIKNQNLKPQLSETYDLSAEYYLPKGGYIAGGVFLKDITDYILTVEGPMAEVAPWLLDEYTARYPGYALYASTANNIGKAKVKGFEISYRQRLYFLPSFLSRFEFYTSFSYIDPTGDITVTNVKTKTSNTQLTYRGKKWRAGITYYWFDDYLFRSPSTRTINDQVVQGDDGTYMAASSRWDMSASYQFASRWSVSFEWRNFTNEPSQRTERFGRLVRNFAGGTIINFSVKANF